MKMKNKNTVILKQTPGGLNCKYEFMGGGLFQSLGFSLWLTLKNGIMSSIN